MSLVENNSIEINLGDSILIGPKGETGKRGPAGTVRSSVKPDKDETVIWVDESEESEEIIEYDAVKALQTRYEKLIEDQTSKSPSDAEIVDARGGYDLLGRRLDNLATKQVVNSLASGSPKGTYTDSAALKAANPDTGVYIATGNGHIYSWTKNQTGEPIDLGVYQSTGISENNPVIRNLITKNNKGILINLLENKPLNLNGYINFATGVFVENDNFKCSDFVKTYFNKVYLTGDLRQMPSTDYYNIYCYDKNKSFIGGCFKGDSTNYNYENEEINLLPDTEYIRINANNNFVKIQIHTFFDIEHLNKIDDELNLQTTYDLYYNNMFSLNGYINLATGVFVENDAFKCSDFIDTEFDKIIISGKIKPLYDNNYYNIYCYDKNKSFIGGCFKGDSTNYNYENEEINLLPNTEYIRINGKPDITIYKIRHELNIPNELAKINSSIKNNRKLTTINSITSKLVLSNTTLKVKLIGDSITHGVGGTGFTNDAEHGDLILTNSRGEHWYVNTNGYCWANLLKEYFESKFNCKVYNYGCTGIASGTIKAYINQLISDDDDIVICMIGTNDRDDDGKSRNKRMTDLYDNLQYIYDYCKTRNIKTIFMSNIPASVANEENNKVMNMSDVDSVIMKFASDNYLEYISVYKKFMDYCSYKNINLNTLLSDGLHPNDNGYKAMFYLICESLGIGVKYDDFNY